MPNVLAKFGVTVLASYSSPHICQSPASTTRKGLTLVTIPSLPDTSEAGKRYVVTRSLCIWPLPNT
jgi:hypothetical protein